MGGEEPPAGNGEPGTVAVAFDRILERPSTLYKGNPEWLRESYIPPRLPHRDKEIERIIEIVSPALRGQCPSNVLVYGKIGTGKTAVITQIRLDFERRVDLPNRVTFIPINCAIVDTHYGLLQTIGNFVAEKDEDRIPTGWSLDRVYASMRTIIERRGGTFIIILDEIDKLVRRSGDEVLYTLEQINTELKGSRVGIIGISNDLKFTESLDARVRSRLNEEKILFTPYNWMQLRDILTDRVKEVFREHVIDPVVIEKCAVYAAQENGDARRALALVRVAAQIAERAGSAIITEENVHTAKASLETDIITACVKTLPQQCKILLWSLVTSSERRRSTIPTGDAYEGYAALCKRLNYESLTSRSVYNYLSEMETLGLVHAEVVSHGRGGRTREISIAVPTQETLSALEEDPLLKPLSKQHSMNQRSLFHYDGSS